MSLALKSFLKFVICAPATYDFGDNTTENDCFLKAETFASTASQNNAHILCCLNMQVICGRGRLDWMKSI